MFSCRFSLNTAMFRHFSPIMNFLNSIKRSRDTYSHNSLGVQLNPKVNLDFFGEKGVAIAFSSLRGAESQF
uniref:Uncharacterized protein n=1 Tax=Caenorhabditis tropicalis TaxID=1561998 RepID=A0A1I7U943_9PELO